MRNYELERLLHKAVADALAVSLPGGVHRRPPVPALVLPLRAPSATLAARRQRSAEHA